MRGGNPLVTVEADQGRVESRLAAGQVECSGCRATHVLLPVTVLLRRAYATEVVGAGLVARAGGWGQRTIGRQLGVPAATVRGWLRVMSGRLEATRLHLLQVIRRVGVDLVVPEALGSPWRDLLAA